ncbi:hypothetical protein BOTCAL_0153g00090 [Botryotinia calthae]|uniref:Uncharacterized protein n=1 Tax=Botryotinia calthae TaxID=38488 RepID=A0A4Y8D2R0_9HELO|nr:hypothetical protein BOTCAL_0153g00090 [Botryotinia calthae]
MTHEISFSVEDERGLKSSELSSTNPPSSQGPATRLESLTRSGLEHSIATQSISRTTESRSVGLKNVMFALRPLKGSRFGIVEWPMDS